MKKLCLLSALLLAACGGGDSDDNPGTSDANNGGSADAAPGPSVCGDGLRQSGEDCDDGNETAGDGCSDTCTGETIAYRATSLAIVDPPLYLVEGGSNDANDLINSLLQTEIDTDEQGEFALSWVVALTPPTPNAGAPQIDFLGPDCTAPQATSTCTRETDTTVASASGSTQADGTCLEAVADSTTRPGTNVATGPCFVSEPLDVTFEAGGIPIMLQNAKIGGSFGTGSPPATISNALVSGFISEAQAEGLDIPMDTPLIGGKTLRELFSDDDRDTGPDGSTLGWYLYINFDAEVVNYVDNSAN